MESARSTLYRNFLCGSIPALLLVSLILNMHEYAVLAAFWVVLLLVALLLSRRRVRFLQCERRLHIGAFEEDTVPVSLFLENTGKGEAELIEVSDRFGPALADVQVMCEPGPLPGRSRRALEYEGYCSRHWGIYTVGPSEITTADPFGLFHSSRPTPDITTFPVYPRVYEVAGLERLGQRGSLTPQEASAGRPGQSLLYLGVREYRTGDEVRRIHWPATARRGDIQVKEYEIDLVPYFTLFLDLHRDYRSGTGRKSTLEYVVRTGASLLYSAVRAGHFVQLFACGAKPVAIPPGRGEAHLSYALQELIQLRQEGTVPVGAILAQRLTALPRGSTATILFGTPTPSFADLKEILDRLRVRGVRPVFLFVNCHSFVPIGNWPMQREEVVERQRELAYFLRSRGVPFDFLDASDDLERKLSDPGFLRP